MKLLSIALRVTLAAVALVALSSCCGFCYSHGHSHGGHSHGYHGGHSIGQSYYSGGYHGRGGYCY
ncbi:MAG: hypothetical protein AAGJ79_13665 [Verrucomicrobiota bacterium]